MLDLELRKRGGNETRPKMSFIYIMKINLYTNQQKHTQLLFFAKNIFK